jgi:hypothetical protein
MNDLVDQTVPLYKIKEKIGQVDLSAAAIIFIQELK